MDDERKIYLLTYTAAAVCSILITSCAAAVDTIVAGESLKDGETIVSSDETYELGFFSPGTSTYRYVGVWYKRISTGTVVWTANRATPITDTSGVLTLNHSGILVLQNSTGGVVWSTNSTGSVSNPVAQLLGSGNFVVRDENDTDPENFIWQGFDHPVGSFLPGMKFGKNLVTGLVRNFVAWKSDSDPSPGDFSVTVDATGFPQLILRMGSNIIFRDGPWNGLRFSGEPNLRPNPIYTFGFVLNSTDIYYHYQLINNSVITKLDLFPNGSLVRLLWIDQQQNWIVYLSPQTDNCDRYALCGEYGSCDIYNSPACGCLEGFQPTNPGQWAVADWTQGCSRRVALDCSPSEGFRKYTNLKLPDTQHSWFNQTMNLDECERMCKNNCSCTAYTNSNISGQGSGCLLWFGGLIDTRFYTNNGQDLYIRMAASELEKDRSSIKKIAIPIITASVAILLGVFLFYVYKRRKGKREEMMGKSLRQDYSNESQREDPELLQFGFSELLKATNNFSVNNKLGEGGFGPVYKGVLEHGQEIAVKRLAKTSTQGIDEFKNEVICISKLQHRNLVRLLGCCIQGEEKMLVYEYMPNRGLDSFIFDETKNKLLDWPRRFDIINGIARGLLYLHQDSRLRIIHRDVKLSNILLDSNMIPKISDFGMARSFGGNQIEANTNRVVGTYGYMSPEYAGDGIFSIKSDVFSFGVLVLEIVSGKRNRGFFHQDHNNNLLGHAWRLYQEGRTLELADSSLTDTSHLSEILRSIHVGLLCVQQRPEDRPTMSHVVLMLGNDGILPSPNQPGFFTEKLTGDAGNPSSTSVTSSTNELTISMLKAR